MYYQRMLLYILHNKINKKQISLPTDINYTILYINWFQQKLNSANDYQKKLYKILSARTMTLYCPFKIINEIIYTSNIIIDLDRNYLNSMFVKIKTT